MASQFKYIVAWQELPSTEAEQIELVVTDLDRIGLSFGRTVGWLDVGLERVTHDL